MKGGIASCILLLSLIISSPLGAVEVIKVAHVPSVLFAPLYVAIEKGYLKEQELDIKLEVVRAGQDAMAMVATGELDAAVGGFSAATFNAIGRGLAIKVVASMGTQPQKGWPSPFMVRKDLLEAGVIKTMADLKGKRVAIAGGGGSTGSYWVAIKLREVGLTLKDIDIVNMTFGDMVIAFKTKAIDAAMPPEPFSSRIRADGTGDIFGPPNTPGASAVGVVYGEDFIKKRPEVGRRFMTALVKAVREIQGPKYYDEENLNIYAKYTRMPLDTLKRIDKYDFHPDLKPDVETLMDLQKLFIAQGFIRYSEPLPPERWVDDSFVRNAVGQLGPYRP